APALISRSNGLRIVFGSSGVRNYRTPLFLQIKSSILLEKSGRTLPHSKTWPSILRFTLASWSAAVLRRFAYCRDREAFLAQQPESRCSCLSGDRRRLGFANARMRPRLF